MKTSFPSSYQYLDSRILQAPFAKKDPAAGYCKTRITPKHDHVFPFLTKLVMQVFNLEADSFSCVNISGLKEKLVKILKGMAPNNRPANLYLRQILSVGHTRPFPSKNRYPWLSDNTEHLAIFRIDIIGAKKIR